MPFDLRKILFRDRSSRAGSVRADDLPVEGEMPEFKGIGEWLNSGPISKKDLAGKAVLIDFWTLSCVNCLRSLPRVKAWHRSYSGDRFAVIGIHTPEFGFEAEPTNVRRAIKELGLTYPVALDDGYEMWNAYGNRYWPSQYCADARGRIRYAHFGEGGYDHTESVIRALIGEAGGNPGESRPVDTEKIDFSMIGTPETYLGFDRLEYLGSPETVRSGLAQNYSVVKHPALNVFYLEGSWNIGPEYAVPLEAGARLVYRHKASRVNLVMDGKPEGLEISVNIDGKPVESSAAGSDLDTEDGGSLVRVRHGRMYNLIDTKGKYAERLLELTFVEPGVRLYAFTFG